MRYYWHRYKLKVTERSATKVWQLLIGSNQEGGVGYDFKESTGEESIQDGGWQVLQPSSDSWLKLSGWEGGHNSPIPWSWTTAQYSSIGSSIFWQTLLKLHCNVDIINCKSSAVRIQIKTPLYEYLYDIWDYEHSIQVCYINMPGR